MVEKGFAYLIIPQGVLFLLQNLLLKAGSFSFTDLLYMCEQFLRDRA